MSIFQKNRGHSMRTKKIKGSLSERLSFENNGHLVSAFFA